MGRYFFTKYLCICTYLEAYEILRLNDTASLALCKHRQSCAWYYFLSEKFLWRATLIIQWFLIYIHARLQWPRQVYSGTCTLLACSLRPSTTWSGCLWRAIIWSMPSLPAMCASPLSRNTLLDIAGRCIGTSSSACII